MPSRQSGIDRRCMGKHTPGGASGGPGGEGRRRGSDGGKRRVPAERRRTPGERTTSAGARGGADSYQLEDAASRRRGSLEAAPARLRMERDRRRAGAKRIAAIVVAVVVVLLVLAGGSVFAYAQHIQKTMQSTIVKQREAQPCAQAGRAPEAVHASASGCRPPQGRDGLPDRHHHLRQDRSPAEEGLAAVDSP